MTRWPKPTPLSYQLKQIMTDWLGAEKEFKRAVELNPTYAPAHQWYGYNLLAMGRQDQAIAEMKRALELDPLSLSISTSLAWHFISPTSTTAIEQCQKTLELDPNFVPAHQALGLTYEQKRMYEGAMAEFQKARSLSQRDPITVALFGPVYAVSGRRDQAETKPGEC